MLIVKIENISKSFKKAIELNPNNAELLNCYGTFAGALGENLQALK